jgi:4-amino-4-deoxy-L-arabinose transferase-like glycosyltransferase
LFASKINQLIVIILLLFFALFLRSVNITQNPVSMYGDELTIVYDSYSILHTGHDSSGDFLPLTLKKGAGRPGGYVYFSIPFVAIFGPSELGVRSLSILSGVGLVWCFYLLAKKIYGSKIGLISAFLVAICPWAIEMSRGGFEANFAFFLVILGIVCWLYKSVHKNLILLSFFCFGLSLHTYPTYKLILPFILVILLWYEPIRFKQKNVIAGLGVFAFFVTLAIFQTFTAGSEERFSTINALALPDTQTQIITKVNQDLSLDNEPLKKIFHNRTLENGNLIFSSYLKDLSPNFLFIQGDQNPRHNPSEMGGLFYAQIVLIFLGFGFLWTKKRFKDLIFFSTLILIAPISASLLLDQHFLRTSFLIFPLTILSALGLGFMLDSTQRKKRLITFSIFFILILGQFIFFADRIYFIAGEKFANFWAYPAKVSSIIALNERSYQYVFLSSSIDSINDAYPVYAQIDPDFISKGKQEIVQISGINFVRYGNVYLGDIPGSRVEEVLNNLNGSYLYLGPIEQKKDLKNYSTISGKQNDEILVVKKRL